ncbi:MAG: WG repeat-containing protein [Bacteroidia bacterium]
MIIYNASHAQSQKEAYSKRTIGNLIYTFKYKSEHLKSVGGSPKEYLVQNFRGDTIFEFDDVKVQFKVQFSSRSDTGFFFLYPFQWKHALPESNGKYGFITKEGEVIVNPIYDAKHLVSNFEELNNWGFHHGLAKVKLSESKYFFINRRGEKVLPDDDSYYTGANHFNAKGIARVCKGTYSSGDLECYWINRKGKRVFEGIEYTSIGTFGNFDGTMYETGYVPMTYENKWRKEFFMLNPSYQETFRLKEKNGYKFPVTAVKIYDNTYELNGKSGYGLVIVTRTRSGFWNQVYNGGATSKNYSVQRMLISFDGEILQDWKPVYGPYDEIIIKEGTFVFKKSDTPVFDFELIIFDNKEREELREVGQNNRSNILDFKPQFDKVYLQDQYNSHFTY